MDPIRNPYAPGAGQRPPELAGRDRELQQFEVTLERVAAGRPERSMVLSGLRGVGKTVLLNRVRQDAEARGFACVWIEAPEERSLPALLAPALRAALLRLSRGEAAKLGAHKALRALASFVKALKLTYADLEFAVDVEAEPGVADSGDLDSDLTDLLASVGAAARERDTALVLFIDELQYVPEAQLGSLISALHAAGQNQLPVALVAAGLPQLLAQTGRAKSYAERLFEFVPIDRLDDDSARAALIVPAAKEGVAYADAAVAEILRQTQGFPYFLQEWGKHAWNVAAASPIAAEDAMRATEAAESELDASFFRVRFDRLTPTEKHYLRAMAELGPGPHRSGDIADIHGRKVTAVAPTRNTLIAKGMLYSPAHGDTAFTVPLFDGFMRRIMPAM